MSSKYNPDPENLYEISLNVDLLAKNITIGILIFFCSFVSVPAEEVEKGAYIDLTKGTTCNSKSLVYWNCFVTAKPLTFSFKNLFPDSLQSVISKRLQTKNRFHKS
ncbi:hypothetical protein BUQ74_20500 [Leptospira weilii serovar Heyan]|uniref:Uncharacterized protein n=1 Tax=Leptospira weilii str. UI 13098 TaxID=1088542 RepID=M6Q676_9LEPT|nr:hypothetical protein LEP1GSC108_0041 [Leptospira weilii str. UI 13098]OMI14740.1 hypothetical protein BUQ74_20500 [Leptospira weilii serovar Heyan]